MARRRVRGGCLVRCRPGRVVQQVPPRAGIEGFSRRAGLSQKQLAERVKTKTTEHRLGWGARAPGRGWISCSQLRASRRGDGRWLPPSSRSSAQSRETRGVALRPTVPASPRRQVRIDVDAQQRGVPATRKQSVSVLQLRAKVKREATPARHPPITLRLGAQCPPLAGLGRALRISRPPPSAARPLLRRSDPAP
jgi:hypothetical protein